MYEGWPVRSVVLHVWVSHVPMLYMWVSHVTCEKVMSQCYTCECVMSQVWMSHVTHVNKSRHTCEWVLAHTWMSHVILIHIYMRIYRACLITNTHVKHRTRWHKNTNLNTNICTLNTGLANKCMHTKHSVHITKECTYNTGFADVKHKSIIHIYAHKTQASLQMAAADVFRRTALQYRFQHSVRRVSESVYLCVCMICRRKLVCRVSEYV